MIWLDPSEFEFGNWVCSNCKTSFVFPKQHKNNYKFCPYCGERCEGFKALKEYRKGK